MTDKYGTAPIIFLDEQKRKEWENLEPSMKREVYSLLHSCADKMETKMMIEMLCNVIIDMDKRIQKLEKESKKYK